MGVISVSIDEETASERAGHLPMGTQLVRGGPPNPLCPGGTCQHGGCVIRTAQDGERAGAAGEGVQGARSRGVQSGGRRPAGTGC